MVVAAVNGEPANIRRGSLRIVHICKVKGIAGAERHLLTLLPAQKAAGDDVRLIVLEEPTVPVPRFLAEVAARGIDLDVVRTSHHLDPSLTQKLTDRLRRQSPDVVHTHLVHADVYGLRAAGRAGITATVSSRHDNNPFRRRAVMRWITRHSMRNARCVVAISNALAGFVRDVEGVDNAPIISIPYGLDPVEVNQARQIEARATLGCPDGRILVGVVGRLIRQKGMDVALDAFARIRGRHRDAMLVIVGEGPLRQALQQRADELGLRPQVKFAGWVDNAQTIMPAFDLMLMPSRWEGLGLAALEAMSCARPLIASNVDALPEIVVDGTTGFLVPPDDADALAAAMEAYLGRPEAAAAAGEAARRRVIECFSVARMERATREVYQLALTMT
jgi:glycosyltransferase involved in cell wall biosynthesis